MKKLIKNTKLLPILIILIGFIACSEDDAVLPQVTANFTYTLNSDTGKVTFINTSENADTYTWNFGDSTTSTEINPIKTYVTGQYPVVLTAKNSSGATATFEDTVYINIPIPVRLPINFDTENVRYEDVVTFPVEGTFKVVDNPDLSGTNTSASKVGELTNNGSNWEGFYYDLDAPIDLSTDNKTIKMNLWSDVSVNVLLKLEEGTTGAAEIVVTHGGTGWEEMIFTFASSTASYNRITFFVDGPGTTAGTFYFDNIEQVATVDVVAPTITLNGDAMMTVIQGSTFTDPGATATDDLDGDITANIVVGGDTVDVNTVGTYTITYNISDAAGNSATEVTRTVEVITPPTAPITSAPAPPARDAADVISIYGETYTNVAIGNYDPNWGQSGHGQVNTAYNPGDGNLVLAYPNFNYQGTDLAGAQDASSMEFLHVDIWVAATVTDRMVKITPISGGEFLVEVPLIPGSWNSVDLPMSAFTGMNWNAVGQMKFDGQFNADGSANTTPFDIYLDNIYFHKAAGSGGGGGGSATAPTVAAPTPPARDAANVISLYSDAYNDITVTEWSAGWDDADIADDMAAGDNVKKVTFGTNGGFLGVDFSANSFNATSMTHFHMDYWVTDALTAGEVLNPKWSNHANGAEVNALELTNPVTQSGQWVSIDVPISSLTGIPNLNRENIAQFVLGSSNTLSEVYLDNIYLYKN